LTDLSGFKPQQRANTDNAKWFVHLYGIVIAAEMADTDMDKASQNPPTFKPDPNKLLYGGYTRFELELEACLPLQRSKLNLQTDNIC